MVVSSKKFDLLRFLTVFCLLIGVLGLVKSNPAIPDIHSASDASQSSSSSLSSSASKNLIDLDDSQRNSILSNNRWAYLVPVTADETVLNAMRNRFLMNRLLRNQFANNGQSMVMSKRMECLSGLPGGDCENSFLSGESMGQDFLRPGGRNPGRR